MSEQGGLTAALAAILKDCANGEDKTRLHVWGHSDADIWALIDKRYLKVRYGGRVVTTEVGLDALFAWQTRRGEGV